MQEQKSNEILQNLKPLCSIRMKEINLHSSSPLLIQSVFHSVLKLSDEACFTRFLDSITLLKHEIIAFREPRGRGLMDGGRDANSRFLITSSAASS